MEVVLDRDAFLKGLQMVQNIVEPRQTLPILANIAYLSVMSVEEIRRSPLVAAEDLAPDHWMRIPAVPWTVTEPSGLVGPKKWAMISGL